MRLSSNVQWPSNLSFALCKLKIYVYKLLSHLKSQSHYEYEICTISSYNPDAIFYEQLVNPRKIRDFYIIQEHSYWNRTNGKDHIMIISMNNIPSYFTESQNLLLNASFLTVIGDKRANSIMEHRYHYIHDIIIPLTADILNLININPRKYVAENRNKNARNVFAIFRDCCRNIGPEVDYSAGRALGIARLWKYLAFGIVSVIVSNGIVLLFENDVDWNSIAVFIRRKNAYLIDEILLSITENEYQRKRQR
ncbi:21806_t:CDS:2, partial [Gigaspora margarita]